MLKLFLSALFILPLPSFSAPVTPLKPRVVTGAPDDSVLIKCRKRSRFACEQILENRRRLAASAQGTK